MRRGGRGQVDAGREPGEEFFRTGIAFDFALGACQIVDLDDAMPVRGVRKLQPQCLGVLACLLNTVLSRQTGFLGLDDGQGKVTAIEEDVVCTALLAASNLATSDEDAAVGEGALLTDGEWGI
jgi:hypothetical protein